MMTFIIKTVISSLLTKSLNNCQKCQISQFSNYIFINGKSHYPVFFKILSAVTPEIVVVWLRRVNEYLWLFKRIYSQFIQNTFGNTGQQLGSIGISAKNVHHGLKNHKCDICCKLFATISEIKKHIKKSHGKSWIEQWIFSKIWVSQIVKKKLEN